MAFTRFHDDPCRIQKQIQESTEQGSYYLNVPGNGVKPHYSNNGFVRLQKWGGNLSQNSVSLESDLRGLTRKLTRDHIDLNSHEVHKVNNKNVKYPNDKYHTDQSRTTHPAWTFRDNQQMRYDILFLNPQENVCLPFENNLNTTLLEKDYFIT
jgi:hypothetical protein